MVATSVRPGHLTVRATGGAAVGGAPSPAGGNGTRGSDGGATGAAGYKPLPRWNTSLKTKPGEQSLCNGTRR